MINESDQEEKADAALLACAALTAMMPGAAAAAPCAYSCVAPLTQASQMMEDQEGPTYRVRGRIGVVRLEPIADPSLPVGPDSPPTMRAADVKITNLDPHMVIMLYLVPRYSPDEAADSVADVYVRAIVDGIGGDRQPPSVGRRNGAWDALELAIEVGEDRVIVETGGQREEFAMRIGRGATVELSCVGGRFDFEEVDWGGAPAAGGSADGR